MMRTYNDQGLVVELTGRCITAHMQQLQVKRSTPRHARCAERCARPGVVIFPEAGPVTPCKPLLNIAYTRPLRHKRPTRRDNRAVPEPTMLVLPARGRGEILADAVSLHQSYRRLPDLFRVYP